ncbi:MAG: TRAP transporter small permease subunit [Aliishimia sp.]
MFNRLEFILDTLGAIAVVALCLLIVGSIFSREVLGVGIPDNLILVRELMVPAILFPLSAATSRRSHVAIEVIANFFSDALNRWIAVLAALCGLVIMMTFFYASWLQVTSTWQSGAHHGGDLLIPKWISRSACAFAFFLTSLRLLQILWIDLKAAITGQPAPATL